MFNEAVDKYNAQLEVGKVYEISGGRIKVRKSLYNSYQIADKRWQRCDNDFAMTFDYSTEVSPPIPEVEGQPGAITNSPLTVTKLKEIESLTDKQTGKLDNQP